MINLEWVSDYIDISDLTPKELAKRVTESDINVEKVITNHIDNLVIGKVISCIDHPDSDHLHVCMVDVGKSEAIQIVCGAPNVREGLKVIVILLGKLYSLWALNFNFPTGNFLLPRITKFLLFSSKENNSEVIMTDCLPKCFFLLGIPPRP